MNIDKFLEIKRRAKRIPKETNNADLNVFTNQSHTEQRIVYNQWCSKCEHRKIIEVKISFYKSQPLTIFEAGLIYYLFGLNKIPSDYVNYHECIAGKRFIENIKEVR